MNKYYLAGVEISAKEKDKILSGQHEKHIYCHSDQPGIPEFWLSDHPSVTGDRLDKEDSLLIRALESAGMELKNSLIVLIYPNKKDADPLTDAKRAAAFICK